jgi:hypothetical protein
MALDVYRPSSNAQIKINTASATSVPQLELRNTQAGCQIGMPADINAMNFITADTERMRIASNGNIIDSPNILRFYYIILIFKQLLKSKFFSNNDVISILIKVIFNDLKNPQSKLTKFIPLQRDIFCSKLNNIFEAYFINETIALLIRSLIQLSSDEPKYDIINKMYQGDKLTLNYLGDYLIKRLNTGNYTYTGSDEKFNNYNPLIKPSDANQGNKIYYISNNTDDKYDQETKHLYP